MTARHRLIVGSAGGVNAFGTIRSVRRRYGDSVFVIAIDTNPRELVAATVLADAFVQVPLARAPDFQAALHELAQSYAGSAYLPQHDEEIDIATRLAADGLLPPTLDLVAPPAPVVGLCWDKWEMHHWLLSKGLPSPQTVLATPSAAEAMGPLVVLKPRAGAGGSYVPQVIAPGDLMDIAPSEWLLQEALVSPPACVEAFLSRDRRIFRCATRQYIATRAGAPTTKARIYNEPVLAGFAERLARELPLEGAFNFDVMRNSVGEWQIIDVNPRVGTGTGMCAAIGLDFACANLADFWGESVEPVLPPLVGAHYVVRQYEDHLTSSSNSADA